MRILTRLWSEDSSTPVSIEGQKQRKRGEPKQTNKNDNSQKRAKATQNTGTRGEGASVEKPDTSLARQFKHLNRKHRKQTNKNPTHKKQETTAQPRRRTRQ